MTNNSLETTLHEELNVNSAPSPPTHTKKQRRRCTWCGDIYVFTDSHMGVGGGVLLFHVGDALALAYRFNIPFAVRTVDNVEEITAAQPSRHIVLSKAHKWQLPSCWLGYCHLYQETTPGQESHQTNPAVLLSVFTDESEPLCLGPLPCAQKLTWMISCGTVLARCQRATTAPPTPNQSFLRMDIRKRTAQGAFKQTRTK